MYCHAPKPLYILMLEHLELQFRVASKPVAALITLLIANGTLYILLIPIVVHCTHIHPNYRIAGNFGGRKLLRILHIHKVFSAKFGSVVSFGAVKASNPRKFSPLKVSHYTVVFVPSRSSNCEHLSSPIVFLR